MIDRTTTAHGENLKGDRGDISVECLNPRLMRMSMRGHMTLELGECAFQTIERLMGSEPLIDFFNDTYEMVGYDSEFRIAITNWAKRHEKRFKTRILVRSRIVAMGVAVSNLALGGAMQVFSNKDKFDAALRELQGVRGAK